MKRCTQCKRRLALNGFAINKTRVDGRQGQCKRCRRAYCKQHYKKNKTYYLDRNKANNRIIRQFVFDYLSTHGCVDCPETNPIVLTFDHVRGKKKFVIAGAYNHKTLKRIKHEITKCEVRCANCHLKKTANQLGWYKDIIRYGVTANMSDSDSEDSRCKS